MASGGDDVTIERADARGEQARAMLDRLTRELGERYRDDGAGDFAFEDMDEPRSAFLVVRVGPKRALAGCGALRRCVHAGALAHETGELKRMFVDASFRGRGLGVRLLHALESEARAFGYRHIWLETGTMQPEAVALYTSPVTRAPHSTASTRTIRGACASRKS